MSPRYEEIRSREELETILNSTEVCRLGLQDDGMPYIIPMNFGFSENCFYFHSAQTGHKIDLLKKDSRISFQCETDPLQVWDEESGRWLMETRSVMAEGQAAFIEALEEKREAMMLIMKRYSGGMEFEYSDESLENLALIRVPIDRIQGRKILR